MTNARFVVTVWFAAFAGSAAAQATWTVRGSEADVRITRAGATPEVHRLRGPAPSRLELSAGEWNVHFGVDAAGKPRSLSFAANDGDDVRVAIDRAAAATVEAVTDPAAWRRVDGGDGDRFAARITGANDRRDARIGGEFVVGVDAVGLVARWVDATHHYRCVLDSARGELRLERVLGEHVLVLSRAAVALGAGAVVDLAMQVEGFRIAVFVDDALVTQSFDGAFEAGAAGTWTTGPDPAAPCRRFTIGPPAAPRASVALVRDDGHARFVAATTIVPGAFQLVELLLDRPGPPLPLTAAGVEPWLVREPASPRVLLADLRGSLGANTFTEVPRDGVLTADLQWPTALLAGRCTMVRSVSVTADGSAVVGTTPMVLLQL